MPHALLKDFKSNLSAYAAIALGQAKAMAIQYAYKVINEVLEELKNHCPSPERLAQLTKKVTGARNFVNASQKKIDKIKPIPSYLDATILGGKILIEILSHDITPSTVGTPPGPQGGVLYSTSMGISAGRANKLNFLVRMVNSLEDEQKAIKDMIIIIDGVFIPIITGLDLIQSLIDACASNQELTDEERKALIQEKQTDPAQEATQYRSTSGKDYTIKVITDPDSPKVAPKRHAIVQDFRGITILTGPSSFASSEQILIDEIKFRIENQLP